MSTLSTENWDTAFGIKYKDANAAIASGGSSPPNFSGSHQVVGNTYNVSASFGTWKMTGGSGSLLIMALPLSNGRVSGGGQAEESFEGTAQIQVSLGFIPQPGSTSSRELRLDNQQAVSVLQVTLSSGPPSARDTIKGALQDWLNTNVSEFNHVFAVVDLNEFVDKSDAFAWVKPTHVGYAIYTENIASADDYLFGILAMTENRPGRNLSPVMDPGIVPDGADAGFLIAASRAVDKMFAPRIETLFANATADDFGRSADGMTIVNVNTLKFTNFTLQDGTVINDAQIDAAAFNVSIDPGFVEIDFTGLRFTWKGKYNVTVNYRSINDLSTDENGHLRLKQTAAPTVSVSASETESQKWKEIWESIGISVAVAVAGAALGAGAEAGVARLAVARAATAGAEASADGVVNIEMELVLNAMTPQEQLANELGAVRAAVRALQQPEAPQSFAGFFQASAWKLLGIVIGAVIGAGIAGIVTALQAYAEENTEKLPTLDGFTDRSTGNVNWAGGTSYTLKSAQLRGPMQLGLVKSS
ncbi:TULIP family P47-like protein [Paraburkholderia youngii]|uniref:TULIP family P47-like protein n=1 Tax=Paraburkholderia youngii TaxID=2782701 RepID=A0A7Y6K9F3_9BURK|nr:TULIP family P47-like protein [Paraburkholderia youngii]NUY05805.1 TULIP family P47-like protein [Paraburkholderia youngii]